MREQTKDEVLEEIEKRKKELVEALKGKLFTCGEDVPATDDEVDGFASFIIGIDLLSSMDSEIQDKRNKEKI